MTVDKQIALDMTCVDAASWATVNKIKLQKGVWDFADRPFLVEPMQARLKGAPRRRCFMKATQGGYSEMQVNETLWGLIHGYYSRGVLYLFPTTDDVREFSKARFGPLIRANPTAIGQYVKDTDTASLKRVGDSFLYLRGAMLSRAMEAGGKESSKLRSISVDKVVYDELDMMDNDVIGKAQGRMGDSDIKEEVYISNPTIPERGISAVWEQSDQRYWFRYCQHCGEWTSAELEFDDNPERAVARDKDGKGYIPCKKCRRPVGLRPGSWVPTERGQSDYMWGYRWSQLSSAANDPWEILEQYRDPPDDNLADVIRLRLGRPYVDTQDKLTIGQVLACCGSSPQLDRHPGPCAMGVDVRKHKNVVIGIRAGRDRYKVVRVARLESWQDILAMANRFNVRSCVVDIRPYEDSARQFQKQAKFKTWLCEYRESTPVGTQYHDSTGICTVNRTEILDATHRLVAGDGQLELPAVCPEIKQFAIECCSIAKVEEINRRTRQPVFRYLASTTKPCDYRHALAYFYLAASGNKVAVAGGNGRRRRQTHAVNEYARC